MKIPYILPLLFLAACSNRAYVAYSRYNRGFAVYTNDSVIPVLNGEIFPHCDDRDTVDWWQVGEIRETEIELERAVSWRLDSLDYYEQRQMKKFDKPAYRLRKHRLFAINYTDNMPYFVYLLPDSIAHQTVHLDSVSAWVLQQRYTECMPTIKQHWMDYWALKPLDQPFVFQTEGLHRKVRRPRKN